MTRFLVILMMILASVSVNALGVEPPAFLLKWGSEGSADGQFIVPRGVAVDAKGDVYVADNGNHRIQKFTSDGRFLLKWGSKGSDDGQFLYPCFIAVDNQGYVYVVDEKNARIQKFTSTGTLMTKWGTGGTGDGEFSSPAGIAVDKDGFVYVVEYANHRVQKFRSDGTFIAKWGFNGTGNGEFFNPYGIAVDQYGYVFVAEWVNCRVQKFTSNGVFITKWGSKGLGNGQFKTATGIAVDDNGNVYVSDHESHRIQVFSANGAYLMKWGSPGSENGQFAFPMQIAIDKNGDIFVADYNNNRIEKFRMARGEISNAAVVGRDPETEAKKESAEQQIDEKMLMKYIKSLPLEEQMAIFQKFQTIKTEAERKAYGKELWERAKPDSPKAPSQKPAYPPLLTGVVSFSEPSGNNLLDADESAQLKLHLSNTGKGDAYYLEVIVHPEKQYSDITLGNPEPIPRLKPGEGIDVIIPIVAGVNIDSTNVAYTIMVVEENGFDMNPPLRLQFCTQRFSPPKLVVADYAIDDLNHNRMVEPSEMVIITARIQNSGSGVALEVGAGVKHGANVFVAGDSKTEFKMGTLAPGEYKDIQFSLYTNNRATAMPVSVELSEQYGKFGGENKLDLPFNVVQKQVSELVVEGKSETARASTAAPKLTADIDRNIPKIKTANPDAIAIVIGNCRYQSKDVPPVEYALEDAASVREYLKILFGYQEGNIRHFENATKAQFEALFGTDNDYRGKLYNYLKPGKSDVFIYYCGHGAPDPVSGGAYFVPSDCDPAVIKLNGYSLDTFYRNLDNLPARSISVVIDACFSGSSNDGMLIKGASPAMIRLKHPLLQKRNVRFFLASQADQIASWYPEKKHGLFTYFFLKGLRGEADLDSDGCITIEEMKNYLESPTEGVPYYARFIWQREQVPVVSAEDLSKILVRF